MCCLLYRFLGGDSEEVLPSKGHRAVGKDTGKTSYIERFNNTMGQGKGNLVKKTLSFSKKLMNNIGPIYNFINHYNPTIFT